MINLKTSPPVRQALAGGSVLFHMAILVWVLVLGKVTVPLAPEPVRILDLVEVFDPPAQTKVLPPPPPPPEKVPPPAPADPKVLAADLGPPAPGNPGTLTVPVVPPAPVSSDAEPDYTPQFKLSALPSIPEKEFRARTVYPELASRQGIEATVILLIYVDQSGKIRKVVVQKDPGFGFGEAALRALDGLTLKPGEIDGVPVATVFRQVIPFKLK